jgi:hypothetical protein
MKIINKTLVYETEEEKNFSNLINCSLVELSGCKNNVGRLTTSQEKRLKSAAKIEESFAEYGYSLKVEIVDDLANPEVDFKILFSWRII